MTVRLRRVLSQREVELLIGTCDAGSAIDLRDRALIIVALETGMTRLSLQSMRLENIKPCEQGYHVAHVALKWSPVDGQPRTRTSLPFYPVPLSPTAIFALEPWRQWLRVNHKITKGPVFPVLDRGIARGGRLDYQPTNVPLSLEAIYAIVARRAVKARLRGVSPKTLHDTFVAWRVAEGLAPYQIAAITGQKLTSLIPSTLGTFDPLVIGKQARLATPEWLARLTIKR